MKKFNYIQILFVIYIIFLSCQKEEGPNFDPRPNSNYEYYIKDALRCMNMSRPKDSYNYPYLPEMEEWSSFKTTQAMVDACQIPLNVLKNQSTQGIIQGLWEFPFFSHIAFRPAHFQMDHDNSLLQLNVYQELMRRNDAGKCLYQRYLIMPSYVEDCYFYSKAFEIVLSQSFFLEQLSNNEKVEIIKSAFEKDEVRQQNPNLADSASREVTWFLIGRILQNAKYKPFLNVINNSETMKLFLLTSQPLVHSNDEYWELFNSIISNGFKFINNNEL